MKIATVDTAHRFGVVQCVCKCGITRRRTVDNTECMIFIIEAQGCDTGGLIPVHTLGFNDFHIGSRLSKTFRRDDAPLRTRSKN